jgi:hypothetical protein
MDGTEPVETKIDFKKDRRDLYNPGKEPGLVDVPEMTFLALDGRGDPNTSKTYADAIQALYTLSYMLKFRLKAAGFLYTVGPLEGLWWADDPKAFASGDKASWQWTAMIRQPDRVSAGDLTETVAQARDKKDLPSLADVRLETFEEGRSAQVMFIGPYASEGPVISRLHEFIAEQKLHPRGKHHEIYLGDPRRSAPEKVKTIIRQPVAP